MEINFNELIHFTDKQKEARKAVSKNKYLLYGGAMGGGKSYFLRWILVDLLTDWATKGFKNVRVGLFCEDYPSLKDRQLSKIELEFPIWLGTLNRADYEFKLSEEYGSGVICFRNLDDPSKYQSAEFAAIAVDELTKNKKEVFDFLRTRLRWVGLEDTKFIAASNPGGIGHAWVKQLWMEKKYESTERESELFAFIPSKATDNPYLPQSYFDALKGLPEEMRKAFIEGNWDIFKGQYFTEWNSERHIIPPFVIPEGWRRFRAYDHGREAPACCKWYALDQDGRVYAYRELYLRGQNVDQIADEINRLSGQEQYTWSVADPSIFTRTGFIDKWGGETLAQNFARHGIMFIPASNRRIDGWHLMHQYLFWDEKSNPKLLYFNTCHNSIRTIPALIYDDKKVEDVDTDSEDHAADTDRYFLMSLKESKGERPKNEIERKLEQIKQKDSSINFSDFYSGKFYKPEAH